MELTPGHWSGIVGDDFHNLDGKPMTAHDYITLLGGTFWLAILVIRQAVAYRSVIRSHRTHSSEERSHD